MIDIHAHILPDLDDGSEDMEESLEMAELSVESGVEIMAATPHSNQMGRFENFQSEQLRNAFEQLRTALKEAVKDSERDGDFCLGGYCTEDKK